MEMGPKIQTDPRELAIKEEIFLNSLRTERNALMITFHVEEGENNLPLKVHYRNKGPIEAITKIAIKLIIPSLETYGLKRL